jgi:hypothetical protein
MDVLLDMHSENPLLVSLTRLDNVFPMAFFKRIKLIMADLIVNPEENSTLFLVTADAYSFLMNTLIAMLEETRFNNADAAPIYFQMIPAEIPSSSFYNEMSFTNVTTALYNHLQNVNCAQVATPISAYQQASVILKSAWPRDTYNCLAVPHSSFKCRFQTFASFVEYLVVMLPLMVSQWDPMFTNHQYTTRCLSYCEEQKEFRTGYAVWLFFVIAVLALWKNTLVHVFDPYTYLMQEMESDTFGTFYEKLAIYSTKFRLKYTTLDAFKLAAGPIIMRVLLLLLKYDVTQPQRHERASNDWCTWKMSHKRFHPESSPSFDFNECCNSINFGDAINCLLKHEGSLSSAFCDMLINCQSVLQLRVSRCNIQRFWHPVLDLLFTDQNFMWHAITAPRYVVYTLILFHLSYEMDGSNPLIKILKFKWEPYFSKEMLRDAQKLLKDVGDTSAHEYCRNWIFHSIEKVLCTELRMFNPRDLQFYKLYPKIEASKKALTYDNNVKQRLDDAAARATKCLKSSALH